MSTLNDYDPWSRNILQALQTSGKEASSTVDFILQNDIRIVIVDNNATNLWWKVKWTLHGPQIQNTLYVSRFIAGKESNDAWALMEFVHESHHLQQGFWTAFSVYGELDAWQLSFRFYLSLPDHPTVSPMVEQLLDLPLTHDRKTLKQAADLISLYENGNTSFLQQSGSVVTGKRCFNDIYWIYALPLNPLFSHSP